MAFSGLSLAPICAGIQEAKAHRTKVMMLTQRKSTALGEMGAADM